MDERKDNDAFRPADEADGMNPTAAAYEEELTEEDLQYLKEADKKYIGSFSHTIDAKGRMVVPQTFRAMLGPSFYIAPSHDFKAIGLYSNVAWARLHHRYDQLDPLNPTVRMFKEFFNAFSFRGQECDGQGRVLLPPRIRAQMLGDEKELEVIGADDHVRVLSSKAYREQMAAFMNNLPDIQQIISAQCAMKPGQEA